MGIEAKVRKWGDSLGVIIPKEVVVEENIEEGDTIMLTLEKEADLSPFFGASNHKEQNTQQFKDELRQIWSR